jgi:hypothetical protein
MKKSLLPKEVSLFFIALRNKLIKKYDKFVETEPQVKEECVQKIVYQLRRDFPIDEQNNIILSVSRKLNELRERDIVLMEEEMEKLKSQTELFKTKVVLV